MKKLLLLSLLCTIPAFGMNNNSKNKRSLFENDKDSEIQDSKKTKLDDEYFSSILLNKQHETYYLEEPADLTKIAQKQPLKKQLTSQNITHQGQVNQARTPYNSTIQMPQTIACFFCKAKLTKNVTNLTKLKDVLKSHILEECNAVKIKSENIITNYKNTAKKNTNCYQANCVHCAEIYSGQTLEEALNKVRGHHCLQEKLLEAWQTIEKTVDTDIQNLERINKSNNLFLSPSINLYAQSINSSPTNATVKIMPNLIMDSKPFAWQPLEKDSNKNSLGIQLKKYIFTCPLCNSRLSSDTKGFKKNVRTHFYQYCNQVDIDEHVTYENDEARCNKCLQLFSKKNKNSSAKGEFLKHKCVPNDNKQIFWEKLKQVEQSFDAQIKNPRTNNNRK